MHPNDQSRRELSTFGTDEWREAEEEMLVRVKEVSHQITERCRLVSGDTHPTPPGHPAGRDHG
jgi:hypothetical protein